MPNYRPSTTLSRLEDVLEYLRRELTRVGDNLRDNADRVFYRTNPVQAASLSLSNGISANWRVAGNVLLVSTSVTLTLTGFQRQSLEFDGMREMVVFNVGHGVLALKSAGSESSASNQMLLGVNYQLSQNHACTLWRDPFASRWRGLSRS